MAYLTTELGNRLLTEFGDNLVTEDHVSGSDAVDTTPARETWLCVTIDVEFDDGHLYLWSGQPNLEYDGKTWNGLGGILEFTKNENTIGPPKGPVTIALNGVDSSVRSRFREPVGQRPVTLNFLRSVDLGQTWHKLPVAKFGYTSNLRQKGGLVQIDLVHPFEVLFRRRPRLWSDEDQRRRVSTDSGFAMMRAIHAGTNILFPYLKQQTTEND